MVYNFKAIFQPAFDVNPLIRLWRALDVASICIFPKYMKLAKMVAIHVLGSVQDERCFSTLSFLKSKLLIFLDQHLQLVVGMFLQQLFTLQSFPYDSSFTRWVHIREHLRYGVVA